MARSRRRFWASTRARGGARRRNRESGRSSRPGASEGGPLAYEEGYEDRLAFTVPLDTAYSWGLAVLRNSGNADAVVETRLARRTRAERSGRSASGRFRRRPRTRSASRRDSTPMPGQDVAGLVVPPGQAATASSSCSGSRSTRPGISGFDGVRVEYRVGGKHFATTLDHVVALCAPVEEYEECPERAPMSRGSSPGAPRSRHCRVQPSTVRSDLETTPDLRQSGVKSVARVRRSLENFFLKNASGLVEGMSEEQGGRLADALGDLEARSARAAVAEVRAAELDRRIARFGPAYEDDRAQIEHLLAELEERDSELARLRPDLAEIESQLDKAACGDPVARPRARRPGERSRRPGDADPRAHRGRVHRGRGRRAGRGIARTRRSVASCVRGHRARAGPGQPRDRPAANGSGRARGRSWPAASSSSSGWPSASASSSRSPRVSPSASAAPPSAT